jgi:ankyrin repeat protein
MAKIILSLLVLLGCIIAASAQNSVSFDNQSGESALVKLIGPTSKEIEVPNGTKQPVQALAGKYFIKVRYGIQGNYHYTKGQEFTVDETATTTSDITITLHKVVNGNYDSSPINEQEFGVADAAAATPSRDTKENQSKELHDAVKNGNLEKVRALLIDNPGLVFSKDNDGETPLHVAATFDQKDIVELLLAKGADVNAKGKDGRAPLLATVYHNVDLVKAMIAAGADVNTKDKDGWTPLIQAADLGHADIVKALIAAHADMNAKNIYGDTAIINAVKGFEYSDCVKALIVANADVNVKDIIGMTALMWASLGNKTDSVNLLIAAHADVNAKDNDGTTALIKAAAGLINTSNVECVKALIAAGADVNAKNKKGWTALTEAGAGGALDAVKALIAAGAKEIDGTTIGQQSTNPQDGALMVWVPAGEFAFSYSPSSKATLTGYWIYKNDVTVAQFQAFCTATRRKMPEAPNWGWNPNDPIVNVRWNDAQDYALWAGVCLPTNLQWEKAARGTDGREYPWGNNWDTNKLCCSVGIARQHPTPVGSYPAGASPCGCLDMEGNVRQWCSDVWGSETLAGKFVDLLHFESGGSWQSSNLEDFRVTTAHYETDHTSSSILGFRCVDRSVEAKQ